MRTRSIKRHDTGEHYAWGIQCPGCGYEHCLNHTFDGNVDRPTFTPSILVTYNGKDADTPEGCPSRCHSHVTHGRIAFLKDSTHALAGQTVELPEYPVQTP
jgi:hypothetical protein